MKEVDMEPLLIILVPGLAGGILLAWLMASGRVGASARAADRPLAPPSPMLINLARIRVEGFGGLGMVAVAVVVAVVDPRIRFVIGLSALCGTALAVVLIARRRRSGALPSGGTDGGAHRLLPPGPPGQARSEADRRTLPVDTVSDCVDVSRGVICPHAI
jgi:hypothetical protein